MGSIARFDLGDAFDRASIAAVSPKPTLGIVSGLYELFPSNEMIRTSLAGMADAVEPGGYLVYTGQPWHPQLEFIARALTSHRGGEAWVMRRRSQVEMDQLVAAAGFEKSPNALMSGDFYCLLSPPTRIRLCVYLLAPASQSPQTLAAYSGGVAYCGWRF